MPSDVPFKPDAHAAASPPRARRRRRKWLKSSPERRLAAAAALREMPATVGISRLAWIVLGLSVLVHAVLLAAISYVMPDNAREVAAAKDSYLEKVIQKERAKRVASNYFQKNRMPPEPPDPEEVVESTLASSLSSDVTKVTHGLMNLELQNEMAQYVRTSLKSELEKAAKEIATGHLTQQEIEALHRKFQEKAQEKAQDWRQQYLEAHQVERASMSTTQWYEEEVSKTLFRNISFELFPPVGYIGHPPSPDMWHNTFVGGYGWDKWPRWDDLTSMSLLREKLDGLKRVLSGQWGNAGGKGNDQHPAWPGPGAEQATQVLAMLKSIHEGQPTVTYPHPSWQAVLYGAGGRPYMTFGVFAEYFPHCQEQMIQQCEPKLEQLWKDALQTADQYQQKAEQGAAQAELVPLRDACFAAVKGIVDTAGKLLCPNEDECRAINWASRVEVIQESYPAMYKLWVDELVAGLEPLIKDFARGQFSKGIIAHKEGVDKAMEEFPTTIVPLIRRDLEAILPLKRFYERVHHGTYPYRSYRSSVTGAARPPNEPELKAEQENLAKSCAAFAQGPALAEKCRESNRQKFRQAILNMKEEILERVLTGGLLMRRMDVFVEGVDYSDKVQEKLNARAAAMKGRGQDLAKLTDEGVPDTSEKLVALMFGASKGHGANLLPVQTDLRPTLFNWSDGAEQAVIAEPAVGAPAPAKCGFDVEQAAVSPTWPNSPRFDGIPYLPKFPRLDGDLSDWGKIRPLMLRGRGSEAILLYAAWNYQGFFFGLKVKEPAERFYYPSMWQMGFNHNTGGVSFTQAQGIDWAFRGDYLRLCFDTLDARNTNRGEPHTQEFVIFPLGAEGYPAVPGVERVISSQRDAKSKDYRGVKATCKSFPNQPPIEQGPDGTGPYRVTKPDDDGYTMEVFLPRSLFNVPVFAPGWWVGFDASVGMGAQPGNNQFAGQFWAINDADRPYRWGDLLLLGTDPRFIVRDAAAGAPVSHGIVPGHSYLVSVADPDRNVHPSAKDTVLVSAEVKGGRNDVEVFILTETKDNSGVFRGYINTQPGAGREVQGVLEVLPLQQMVLGYVDFANAQGKRNSLSHVVLPVLAPISNAAETAGR